MAAQGVIERREDQRVLARFPVHFQVISRQEADNLLQAGTFGEITFSANVNSHFASKGKGHEAMAENISLSGLKLVGDLQIVSEENLHGGSLLMMDISIPEITYTIHAIGQVMWCLPREEQKKFSAGLHFLGIHKQELARVERYIFLQRKADAARLSTNSPAPVQAAPPAPETFWQKTFRKFKKN